MKIVYSPFNGTGNLPVRRILREIGFENVYVVPEQEMPDPDFTTLDYPNPEDPKAFTLALALAKEKNADIVLATDPDADRLGIYALDTKSGEYAVITMPEIHPSSRSAKESSGVGLSDSNTYALMPLAARQSAASSANSGDFLLES